MADLVTRRRDIARQSYLGKCSNGIISTSCFDMRFIFEHVLSYFIIDNSYKLLIIFQRVIVYLNETIEINKLIKLSNQSN